MYESHGYKSPKLITINIYQTLFQEYSTIWIVISYYIFQWTIVLGHVHLFINGIHCSILGD